MTNIPRDCRLARFPMRLSVLLLAAVLAPCAEAQVQTLPSGLTVVNGSASVAVNGGAMTVTNSANSILNWQSFSIGQTNAVHFEQPNAASQVLNRVTGNDPSSILGSLTSNGRVWLLNPNGVLFGQGARVDVAGLVVSTLNLNNSDWLAGRYSFQSEGPAAGIVNQGELRTSFGGRIALLGGNVRNEGLIDAPGGQVLLAAGRSIELVDTGTPNLRLQVTAPEGEALNLGTLAAAGGRIDVHAAMVNQQGIVRAGSLATNAAGEIVLTATDQLNLAAGSLTSAAGASGGRIELDSGPAGTTMVQGAVLATGSSGAGGQITALGKNIGLIDDARMDVSGMTGGGQIHVGGGERGQDPALRNAEAVYIASSAQLVADATDSGDGGKIVLWGDEATRAYGSFSARGGPNGGNGGFIETSGYWIDVQPALIDTSAAVGQAGTWLLDPYNILIRDAGPQTNVGTINSSPNFFLTSTGTSAVITTSTIVAALNAGNNVVITNGAGGSQSGTIFMGTNGTATIEVAPTHAVSLTLQATDRVYLYDATIVSTGAALNVSMSGNSSGLEGVNVSSSTIATNGGNITLANTIGTSAPTTGVTVGAGSMLDAGTGSITVQGQASRTGVLLSGSSLSAASISVQGSASNLAAGSSDIITGVIANNNVLNAVGTISLDGTGIAPSSGAYGISMQSTTGSMTAGSGITLTGTSNRTGVLLAGLEPLLVTGEGVASIVGVVQPLAGYSGSSALGVHLQGTGDSTTALTGKNVSITGTGTSSNGVAWGMWVDGKLIDVTGTLTLKGQGEVYGLIADGGSSLSSTGGAVKLLSPNLALLGVNVSSAATGDAIVMAGGDNASAASVDVDSSTFTASNGRWLIYGADPGSVQTGALGYDFKQYNATYGTSNAQTPATGNGVLYTLAPVVTVSSEASFDRTYNGGTDTRTLAGAALSADSGLEAGDSLTGARAGATGQFSSKNVGNNRTVTIAGSDLVFADTDGHAVYGYQVTNGITGNITPATLSYAATPTTVYFGQPVPPLGGSVTGFFGADTIGNSTTGTLAFTTLATAASPLGAYAVTGSGLSAANYGFVQAAANTTALIIASPPPIVQVPITSITPAYTGAAAARASLAAVIEAIAPPSGPSPEGVQDCFAPGSACR